MTTKFNLNVHHLSHRRGQRPANYCRELDTDQRTARLQDTLAIFVSRSFPAPQRLPGGFGFAPELVPSHPPRVWRQQRQRRKSDQQDGAANTQQPPAIRLDPVFHLHQA